MSRAREKAVEERGFVADANGFAPNVPFARAVRFHKSAQQKVRRLERIQGAADSALQEAREIEGMAIRAVALAFVQDLAEAAQRAVYLEAYWRDRCLEDGGVNAHPFLSCVIIDLRRFLPLDSAKRRA